MVTWVDTQYAIAHIKDVRGTSDWLAGKVLYFAAQGGKVRARANTKGGQPLAVPEILSPEHWTGPYEMSAFARSVARTVDQWGGIEFGLEDLLARFPLSGEPRPNDASHTPGLSRRAGRKPKLDWHDVFGEALRRVYLDIPESDHAFAAEASPPGPAFSASALPR